MDNIYSRKRSAQYRGPTTSDDYNARIEENYKDLLHLANRVGVTQEDIVKSNRYILKNLHSMSMAMSSIETLFDYLFDDVGSRYIQVSTAIEENWRFEDTSFAIAEVDQCTLSTKYRQLTLPQVLDTSASKLKFEDDAGNTFLPSTFEAFATGVNGTIDDASAFINTSDVADAIVGGFGSTWERNIVVNSVDEVGATHAEVDVYIKIPEDVSAVAESNCIIIDPYPILGTTIKSIKATTAQNPLLRDSDGYVSLNPNELYEGDLMANGKVPPGAYDGDAYQNAPPSRYYFDPTKITAVKVTLSQKNFVEERLENRFIFTYGMNEFDVRYDKFLDTGKVIYRIDAPDSETFSTAPDVTPLIYNVSLADIPYVFDYRVIWETAYNSEVYTTNPVPLSTRVWVEVTLNKTTTGITPVLSALKLN